MLALRRFHLSLSLLFGQRAPLFLGVDLVVVLMALTIALATGTVRELYVPIVFLDLVLGVPILSDVVALERRAGSLDIALSSPGAGFYFERRVLAFTLAMTLQSWLILAFSRAAVGAFPLLPALIQTALVAALLSAAALFWAVRLESPGAVLFGTLVFALALAPWIFENPISADPRTRTGLFLRGDELFDFAKRNLVLASTGAILYLYARRRLARPEAILS